MSTPHPQSPELTALFEAYTGHSDSIGSHLAQQAAGIDARSPLLVATSTDLALYPGNGAAPEVLGFRMSTRGFKELAGVSHLGPALATLAELKQRNPQGRWRSDAELLQDRARRARAANSGRLWRDIGVGAYLGREDAIADMIDFTLLHTADFLARALTDPDQLSFETLRSELLDDGVLPVSFNRMMIATFFLVGMDISHRLIAWLDDHEIDWPSTMVLIAGKQGRPTAGVTWRANSVAAMILAASRGRLPLPSLYIAPHAPTFATPSDGDLTAVQALEPALRALWSGTRAVVGLAAEMFPSYPAFTPDGTGAEHVDGSTTAVAEMPAIAGPDDWRTLVTRLRLVMEDPRQLLSGAVSDYAATQLAMHDNDPTRIIVPGLDGEPYPKVWSTAG